MEISKTTENGTLTLKVGGRLDTNTSPQLEAELPGEDAGIEAIRFDFGALDYISSAGLRVLIMAQKRLAATGGKVTVAGANDMVRGVLDMTGLSTILGME